MPATRVSVASNAKQSLRAPLLVSASLSLDPSSSSSAQSLVFETARSKLRIRKPVRVFVGGTGHELVAEDDWKRSLKQDAVLLVSAGEEYVGVRRDLELGSEDANPGSPVHVLAQQAPVEQLAITHLTTTARTLPRIIYTSGQPDLCPGTKYPVGAVFVSQKWIHPLLIGSDIRCGMAWYKTTLSRNQVDGDKGRRIAEKLRGLEGPWRTQIDREHWLYDEAGSCSAGAEWDRSVGTIGAGNHFAEIQVVEDIASEAQASPALQPNDVVLLVHSGSRGYGGSILKRGYMEEHTRALRWAKANRDLIALRFLACIEPGDEAWELGLNVSTPEHIVDRKDLTQARKSIKQRKVVDIWHNNLERVRWPPLSPAPTEVAQLSSLENSTQEDYVYIHRKGAAPTHSPETSLPLPLLPLPGSRGTPTMMIKPIISEANAWGHKNALSLAHGAGRSMSRAKALSSLSRKYRDQDILKPKSGEGTWVICDEKDLVYEEAPDAYKNIDAVTADLVQEGVAEVIGWCAPRVSYKTRNEAR